MTKEEVIKQLESLLEDRNSFEPKDKDPENIFRKDAEALKYKKK